MIRYLFLILNFIGILLVNLFYGDVVVTINAPNEVVAGNSFTVEISITKSDLRSFGRYKQDLPIGYTATPLSTFSGDFSFKDHIVKIVWNPKLPSDSTFTISYNIKVDPTAEGPLNIGGSFSYIYENEVKTMNVPSKSIIIKPSENLANNTNNQTNVNNQQNNIDTTQQINNNVNSNNSPIKEIFCYQEIVRESDGLTVHLLVSTKGLAKDKFAKIQETIPDGYSATNIESKNGIFSFKDNSVKFLWMSLPVEDQFQISYKLAASAPSSDLPDISGNISYIENDATKIKSIVNRDFINSQALVNNNTNQDNNNTNNNTSNQNNQNNNQVNNNSNQNLTNNNHASSDSLKNNLVAQSNNKKNNKNQNKNQNKNTVKDNTITSPETGVRYKVQLAAGHNAVNPKYYFHQYNISERVQMEMHEGWHKYTIGSFTIYKDARDRRVQIWQDTPIRDAFVSAYNNGTRITVQEALMVANQKWYQ